MKLSHVLPPWKGTKNEAPILPTHVVTKSQPQGDQASRLPQAERKPGAAVPQPLAPAPAAPWHLPRPNLPGTPQQWADGLWYLGHVMGAGSLLSHYTFPTAATLVCVGQFMVIISRPIGRLPATPPPGAADDMV